MPDVEYKLFCCREEPTCGFTVQARTEEEVMEHARTHMAKEHGMEDTEATRRVEGAIRPVPRER